MSEKVAGFPANYRAHSLSADKLGCIRPDLPRCRQNSTRNSNNQYKLEVVELLRWCDELYSFKDIPKHTSRKSFFSRSASIFQNWWKKKTRKESEESSINYDQELLDDVEYVDLNPSKSQRIQCV